MNVYYIAASSVTYAQMLKKLLEPAGLRAKIVKQPSGIRIGGCGYAVTVQDSRPDTITELLRGAGSHDFRLYQMYGAESFREIKY